VLNSGRYPLFDQRSSIREKARRGAYTGHGCGRWRADAILGVKRHAQLLRLDC